MSLTLSSSTIPPNGKIPKQYTGGDGKSPPLTWTGEPANTQSYALLMDDPDAPSGDFVHWLAWNIPAQEHALPEDVAHRADTLEIQQGKNSYAHTGYDGPSPPPGKSHRYVFHLYALDDKLPVKAGASRSEVETAMRGHVLAEAQLVGSFRKR